MYDVIVVGGGPAGLQAALTLGRVHRAVLLLDSGQYRNATVEHMQNFIGRDGTPPAELRAIARKELEAYETVDVRDVIATSVERDGNGFLVSTVDETLSTRAVVLATGVRDTLPGTPGLAELWGREAAHCPFCHGHEVAGRDVGILVAGPHTTSLGALLSRIASSVVVLADGDELADEDAARLTSLGIDVRPEPVSELRRTDGGLVAVLDGGGELELGGIFVAPAMSQSAPFAEQLGLAMLPSGCIEIDALGHTSVSGIYAAGDLAHTAALPKPLASVLNAAAAGQTAGSACAHDLLLTDGNEAVENVA
jgi:thioredoxin reductase